MISVTITPLGKSEQVAVVVSGGQDEISDLWQRVNTSEVYQRVRLDDERVVPTPLARRALPWSATEVKPDAEVTSVPAAAVPSASNLSIASNRQRQV